jgi:alkaline phosphatase
MRRLITILPLFGLLCTGARAEGVHARNVILFLGDAGGIPTLNAAGIYAHDKPQSLFIQSLPHIALSDTSSLDAWVTDSAAGMTAIVTGRKTNNSHVSKLPGENGQPLKTILEYAEEHGLATGVVTNMAVWDATPAACYAHASSRKSTLEIFHQVFTPRFGDGVDVLIGADRKNLFEQAEKAGLDLPAALAKAGYTFFDSPTEIPAGKNRVVSVFDGGDFVPQPVIDRVLTTLAQNPQGYFLMVEWDMHASKVQTGLDRVIVMDELIRHVAANVSSDTLIIFAADHSFDVRLLGGKRSEPMAPQILSNPNPPPPWKPVLRAESSHTGEEILVAAKGPGAEALHGFIPNTAIFQVMMSAYGWKESPSPAE